MNIGNAIKEIRKEKSLSQQQLAEAAGITQAAMSGIENGKKPNPGTMARLCRALEVSESLVYAMAMEKSDVPEEKRVLYDSLFPVIKDLVMRIAKKD